MKKFWKKVSIKKITPSTFQIMLDEKNLQTPLKRELVLPNLNLTQEIVKEWDQDSKELLELQKNKWDPIIFLIEKYIGAKVQVFQGILPKKQQTNVYSKLKNLINQFNIFELSALHRITNITGSVFLSLCVLKNDISKNEVFEISFLDELWQSENWGFDVETSEKRKHISIELNRSIFFLDCL